VIVSVMAAFAFFAAFRTHADEPLQLPDGATRSLADWENIYRPASLKRMEEVMGALPHEHRSHPLNVKVIEEVDCGEYVRRFVTYESEPGSGVPAYLLIPKRVLTTLHRTHGILTLHQTHSAGQKVVVGLGGSPNDEYGVELVKRGYVCIAPAYPLLANYHPDVKGLGYESGTMKAIWDNIRALDLLESLPFVKRGEFGSIGHSLGGHNGLYTAAFDPRIKIVVTSCGFDSFRDYKGGDIRGWTSLRYMPRLLNYHPSNIAFDFHDVFAVIAPRRIFVSAPKGDSNFDWKSVDRVTQAAAPIFELYDARENIHVEHPDVGHVFPRDIREGAYRVIEKVLPPLKDP
jgi:dienelactone hydrolase